MTPQNVLLRAKIEINRAGVYFLQSEMRLILANDKNFILISCKEEFAKMLPPPRKFKVSVKRMDSWQFLHLYSLLL